jgi:hypothetical protein
MPNPEWPDTLPQSAFLDSWQEKPADALTKFEPEVGPAKVRSRISSAGREVEHNILLTVAQRTTLMNFYTTTLKNGSLEFDWVHPIDGGDPIAWRFEEPPVLRFASHNRFTAELRLRIMP